jgi:hypothetical protein
MVTSATKWEFLILNLNLQDAGGQWPIAWACSWCVLWFLFRNRPGAWMVLLSEWTGSFDCMSKHNYSFFIYCLPWKGPFYFCHNVTIISRIYFFVALLDRGFLCYLVGTYTFVGFQFLLDSWRQRLSFKVFPCFFLSSKAKVRVIHANMRHGPHSSSDINLCCSVIIYIILCIFCV